MCGKSLEVTSKEKYLGVFINSRLDWSSHVDYIVKEARKKLGVIRRGFKSCSNNVRNVLYHQIVLSKVEYCCSVWDPYNICHVTALEQIQKQAAKYLNSKLLIKFTSQF